jgi:hypothetical protein
VISIAGTGSISEAVIERTSGQRSAIRRPAAAAS